MDASQSESNSTYAYIEPAVLSNVASVDKNLINSVNSSTLHTSNPNLQSGGLKTARSGSTGFLNSAAAEMSSYFPGGTLRKKSLSSLGGGEELVSSSTQPSQPRYR
jgi:hypothetical protein